MAAGYKVYICQDGPYRLSEYSWQELQKGVSKLNYQLISWEKLSLSFLKEEAQKYRLLFLVADPKTKEQNELIEAIKKELDQMSVVVFLIGEEQRPNLATEKVQMVDVSLKPEFLIAYIERTIMVFYFQLKYSESFADELEWLRRIEKIFDLTREEILNSEMTAMAYENLLMYEEKLLQEQKRVNEALERLQDFREETKKDWLKERSAREALESLMARELRDRNEQLKAQELLLQYTAKERQALYSLMKLLQEKGSLSKQEVEDLLEKQDVLLKDVERLLRFQDSEN